MGPAAGRRRCGGSHRGPNPADREEGARALVQGRRLRAAARTGGGAPRRARPGGPGDRARRRAHRPARHPARGAARPARARPFAAACGGGTRELRQRVPAALPLLPRPNAQGRRSGTWPARPGCPGGRGRPGHPGAACPAGIRAEPGRAGRPARGTRVPTDGEHSPHRAGRSATSSGQSGLGRAAHGRDSGCRVHPGCSHPAVGDLPA